MERGIIIKTFGGFHIGSDDNSILLKSVRNNNVHSLFQYMILHRDKRYTKAALIDILYGNEDVENPGNALKIVIHRLRKMLYDYGISPQCHIIYQNGEYFWNQECICQVDAEIFEACIIKASDEQCGEEESARLYQKAFDLYEGEFLPHLYGAEWALALVVRYQNMYLMCVKELFAMAGKTVSFEQMLENSNKAIAIYYYNEELHYIRIYCLYKLGRHKEALAAYNLALDMLFDEYGIHPSSEMKELYKDITGSLQNMAESVFDIRDSMGEEDEESEGAYYSNFQNFTDCYRFVVRGIERSGQSIFLMLCNLVDDKGRTPENEEILGEAAEKLHIAIKTVLRKGDLFTRYSATQFLILLVGINQENCSIVFKRIEKEFQKSNKIKKYHIQYKVVSATEILR